MDSKQSWKWIEAPLNSIRDLLLHQSSTLRKQKNAIIRERRLNNWHVINQEKVNASRSVKQLKGTLRDLENLRSKLETADVDKFDKISSDVKQDAFAALKEYENLERKIKLDEEDYQRSSDDEEKQRQEEQEMLQLSKENSVLEVENEEYRARAEAMEQLERDAQGVNELFHDLGNLIHAQGAAVDTIEENIDTTHENVIAGEKQLAKAAKYKAGMYPLMGAVVGTCLGGPIGALAGLKIGGLAAVTGSVLGFTGGRMIKSKQGESMPDENVAPNLPEPEHV